MTDQAQRTAWALQLFEGFVNSWAPPAMQAKAAPNDLSNEVEQVRRAIRSIAPPTSDRLIGYAVYGLKPERPDRRRESGFEAVVVSAVFDDPPTAIMDTIGTRTYWSNPDHQGLLDFGICRLQQIST